MDEPSRGGTYYDKYGNEINVDGDGDTGGRSSPSVFSEIVEAMRIIGDANVDGEPVQWAKANKSEYFRKEGRKRWQLSCSLLTEDQQKIATEFGPLDKFIYEPEKEEDRWWEKNTRGGMMTAFKNLYPHLVGKPRVPGDDGNTTEIGEYGPANASKAAGVGPSMSGHTEHGQQIGSSTAQSSLVKEKPSNEYQTTLVSEGNRRRLLDEITNDIEKKVQEALEAPFADGDEEL